VVPPNLLHKNRTHLQTFPYPSVPNLFLNSNSFMVIWRSQTLSFQKHDGQKHQTFCSPGGVRSPSPTKLGMVIEEVCSILGGLKHVPSDSSYKSGKTLRIQAEFCRNRAMETSPWGIYIPKFRKILSFCPNPCTDFSVHFFMPVCNVGGWCNK